MENYARKVTTSLFLCLLEKDIVLNIIRMAALGEEGPQDLPSRPPTREHRCPYLLHIPHYTTFSIKRTE